MSGSVEWRPPFVGKLVDNCGCPWCCQYGVHAREDSSADPRPAYCAHCHALLELEVFEVLDNPVCVRAPK